VFWAAMWEKQTRACIRASCRGWSSFKPGTRLPVERIVGWLRVRELPAIDEGLQDVMLHIEVAVDNGGALSLEEQETVDGLGHRVVGHVVGVRLSAEKAMIPNVLFDEPVAAVGSG